MSNDNILVFSPHADDATIFVGGTLLQLARAGKKIYIARVTNDDFDSRGLDRDTTLIRNKEEAEKAYSLLGAAETIHMGYQSDYMMSADYAKLRGDIVALIRRIRPYTVFTFDLDMPGESNMDHRVIGNAVHEALWIAAFDLHYHEQIENGLLPYSVPETVLFSTAPDASYEANDISDVIDEKISALCCHKTPIDNMLRGAVLSAECAGLPCEELKEALSLPLANIVDMFGRKLAAGIGEPFGIGYAEMIKKIPPSLGIFGG